MSNSETSTTDLLDQAMTNEGLAFRKRIESLEGDELFIFARLIAELKLPREHHDTSIGDIFHTARNMSALDDVQHMIYNFR